LHTFCRAGFANFNFDGSKCIAITSRLLACNDDTASSIASAKFGRDSLPGALLWISGLLAVFWHYMVRVAIGK
jgi:hypothetical protein